MWYSREWFASNIIIIKNKTKHSFCSTYADKLNESILQAIVDLLFVQLRQLTCAAVPKFEQKSDPDPDETTEKERPIGSKEGRLLQHSNG